MCQNPENLGREHITVMRAELHGNHPNFEQTLAESENLSYKKSKKQ